MMSLHDYRNVAINAIMMLCEEYGWDMSITNDAICLAEEVGVKRCDFSEFYDEIKRALC